MNGAVGIHDVRGSACNTRLAHRCNLHRVVAADFDGCFFCSENNAQFDALMLPLVL